MSCLRNWIGIKGCTVPEDFSGVYVNQLPGSPLSSIEGIANEDQVTYEGVWNDIQERAERKFANRVTTWLQRQYKLKNVRSSIDIGRFIDTADVTLASNQYRGFSYELKFKYSFHRSAHASINVTSVSIYLTNAKAGLVVKIIDLDTGEVLYTKTFNALAGWNTFNVNGLYKSDRIFIGYDDDGTIDAPELPLNEAQSKYFSSLFRGIYGGHCNGVLQGASTIDKAQIGLPQTIDVVNTSNTYGVSAVLQSVCSFENFICANKQLFTTAYWYLCGAELMIERQASPRFNRWTTVDKDGAADLQAYFISEYEKELDIALTGVRINTNDGCVVCNAIVQQEESFL